MPQVPTYGAPKVARDPLSAGKLNPVQSDAGEVIGKAVQGLGDAMQSVGQAAFELGDQAAKKAQGKPNWSSWEGDEGDSGGQPLPMVEATDADRAAALEAQRQADQDAAGISDAQLGFSSAAVQQLGPDGGLTGLQGRDAMAAAPQVRQGLADAYNDAVDSLPPGPARAQGAAALGAQRAGAERLVDGYMAGQPAVHYNQALAARVVSFQQQTAPLYLIDPSLAEHNLGQMDLAQRELDLRSGTPLDRHVANQLQNHSTAWSSLVDNRIAAGDWRKAQEILSDRGGELTYADRARLQPAVTDGVNLSDGRAWAESSLTAGWAGRHGADGADPQAAPPVGLDPQAHLVRAAASAASATLRERERLVAEAVTGGLPAQAAADGEEAGAGEGGDQTDTAVAAALDRDRTAQALAGRALGRAPDDWQVAFVARQPAPQAGAALLGASRDTDAAKALTDAGVSPADARTVLHNAGAQPGATVGEALDAARDGYGRSLQQAARAASARPQALFTPDHLPDRDAYLALADLAAGPDPARRQAFRAAAATHWQDLSDAQEKKRTDALDTVAPELTQGIPYSKWDPAKQAALDPRDRKALIDAEAHPAPPQGDPTLLADIRQIYANADPAFKTLNPAHLAGLLNPAQLKQVMQWREDVLKNGADGPTAGQIAVRRTLGAVHEVTRGPESRPTGMGNGSAVGQSTADAASRASTELLPEQSGVPALPNGARSMPALNGSMWIAEPDRPNMRPDFVLASVRTSPAGLSAPSGSLRDVGSSTDITPPSVDSSVRANTASTTQEQPAAANMTKKERKAQAQMSADLQRRQRNADDDVHLEPPQPPIKIPVIKDGERVNLTQLHKSQEYSDINQSVRLMVNIPHGFSGWGHDEYGGRLEYNPTTKKYRFDLFQGTSTGNSFGMQGSYRTIAFWHVHPPGGADGSNAVITGSPIYENRGLPPTTEGQTDTQVSRDLTKNVYDADGLGYPDGMPALLTTPDGQLRYFPTPATDPTRWYPITNYDLSRFIDPAHPGRLLAAPRR